MHGARMHYSTVGLYITVHVDTDIADICPTVQYTYVATMYSCAGTAEATYRYYRYLCSIELDLLPGRCTSVALLRCCFMCL